MKKVIGLGISTEFLRAVLVHGRRVLWYAERVRSQDPLHHQIRELFAATPPLPASLEARVAVGPAVCQLKLVSDLPRNTSPRDLARIVGQLHQRFFLGPRPLITGGVHVTSPGTAWAAAVDAEFVKDIADALADKCIGKVIVLPVAVCLPACIQDEHIRWCDGDIVLDICRSGSSLSIRRYRTADICDSLTHTAPPELEGLGANAARYADALGAAVLSDTAWLRVGINVKGDFGRLARRRVLRLAGLMSAAAALALLLSPLRLVREARDARAELDAIRDSNAWTAYRLTVADLARAADILHDGADFHLRRQSHLKLLAELAQVLPSHSAISGLIVEDNRVTIRFVGPDSRSVVKAFSDSRAFRNVELLSDPGGQAAGIRFVVTGHDSAVDGSHSSD